VGLDAPKLYLIFVRASNKDLPHSSTEKIKSIGFTGGSISSGLVSGEAVEEYGIT
jgi:hypothetical protein